MSKLQAGFLTAVILLSLGLFVVSISIQPKEKDVVTQELSADEYQKLRNELVTILAKKDARVALAALREKATAQEKVARVCHDLVHELGHEAYETYGDFGQAMQYQDDLCNSGYLHGIIESHFKKSQNIFTTMQTVCDDYSEKSFIGWQCFHGVGHGLMYFTENDLPKSLTLCESYTNMEKRMTCSNGVFMENFNVDQKVHVSKYVKASDPLYPCRKQKNVYKPDCYLYAPTYYLSMHKNHYTEALTLCKTAEKDFQLVCIGGVGSQAMKEHIASPKFVESLCIQGSRDETTACIAGMVGLSINHFGGLTEAKALCGKLEKDNQNLCQKTIASRAALF